MKPLLTIIALLALALLPAPAAESGIPPLPAQQQEPALNASLKAWASSKIETLEFDNATFDQAFAKIKEEWKKQHPDLSLPLAVATYNPEIGTRPMITMSLKRVPFAEALDYIGDASLLRLAKDSKFPHIEVGNAVLDGDWTTTIYPISPVALKKLELVPGDAPEKVAAAYARFGVELQPWMTITLSSELVILSAEKEQHQLVAGINRLLEKGFTITPPEKK